MLDDLSENKSEEVGWTPLHLAIVNESNVEVIDALLNAARDGRANNSLVDLQTSQGRSALDFAELMLDHLSKEQIAFANAQKKVQHKQKIVRNSHSRIINSPGLANSSGLKVFSERRRSIKKIVLLLKEHADQGHYFSDSSCGSNDILL